MDKKKEHNGALEMVTTNGAREGFRPCPQKKKERVFKRMRFRFHQKRIDSRPH